MMTMGRLADCIFVSAGFKDTINKIITISTSDSYLQKFHYMYIDVLSTKIMGTFS